jgi:hypothetical protein
MRLSLRLVLPLLPLLLGACFSVGAYQTAHTVGADHFQCAVEPAFEGGSYEKSSVAVPRFDFDVRYGLTDRIDIGGGIGAKGLELAGKFQLTNPANRGFVVSLAPSAGGLAIGGASDDVALGAGLLTFTLPVLFGIGIGESSEVVIGHKVLDVVAFAGSDDGGGAANLVLWGGSLGFCLSLGRFKLLPEVAVVTPLVGSVGNTDDGAVSKLLRSRAIFQFGLGFLFGGR